MRIPQERPFSPRLCREGLEVAEKNWYEPAVAV